MYIWWLRTYTKTIILHTQDKQADNRVHYMSYTHVLTKRCKRCVRMRITLIISPACGNTAIPYLWAAYGDPEACHPVCYQQQRNKETDCPKEFTAQHSASYNKIIKIYIATYIATYINSCYCITGYSVSTHIYKYVCISYCYICTYVQVNNTHVNTYLANTTGITINVSKYRNIVICNKTWSRLWHNTCVAWLYS